MKNAPLTNLKQLENDYYDGVSLKRLCPRVVSICRKLQSASAREPVRRACEVFAPMLWGQPSGSRVDAVVVRDALAGRHGADYLRAWAHFFRVAETYRLQA